MQVDLGSDYEITGVSLWRYWTDSRTYNATALVVASKPDFSDAQVLYYSGDSDVFGLGKDPKDSLYAETSAGKRLFDAANSTAATTRVTCACTAPVSRARVLRRKIMWLSSRFLEA